MSIQETTDLRVVLMGDGEWRGMFSQYVADNREGGLEDEEIAKTLRDLNTQGFHVIDEGSGGLWVMRLESEIERTLREKHDSKPLVKDGQILTYEIDKEGFGWDFSQNGAVISSGFTEEKPTVAAVTADFANVLGFIQTLQGPSESAKPAQQTWGDYAKLMEDITTALNERMHKATLEHNYIAVALANNHRLLVGDLDGPWSYEVMGHVDFIGKCAEGDELPKGSTLVEIVQWIEAKVQVWNAKIEKGGAS